MFDKKKYLKLCLELIFILSILIGGSEVLETRKNMLLQESDEVAWIFTGYYFKLYFLRFDIFNPDWNDYESFDHPPLAKYIVGGSLFLKGHTIDTLDPKRFWNTIPLTNMRPHFEMIKDKIPDPITVVPYLRSVIFAFALSSLFLLYIFIRISYGILPAFLSTLLIMINPIFIMVSTRIVADPILLFFFALFTLLGGLYWRSKKEVYIILAFIVSAFAFLTKLNGILLVFLLILFFLVRKRFSVSKRDRKLLMTGILIFIAICVLLNPVFLNSGLKAIGRMADARLSAFHRIPQETSKDAALFSLSDRFITATRMIFLKYSPLYRLIRVPVELIMFIAGFCYILIRRDLFLMLMLVFFVVIPISLLPFNAMRYFYWIMPFTHMVAGLSLLSLHFLINPIWNKFSKKETGA